MDVPSLYRMAGLFDPALDLDIVLRGADGTWNELTVETGRLYTEQVVRTPADARVAIRDTRAEDVDRWLGKVARAFGRRHDQRP